MGGRARREKQPEWGVRSGQELSIGFMERGEGREGRRKTSEMDEVEVEVEVRTKQCDAKIRGEEGPRHVRKTAFVSSFVLCPPFLFPCLVLLFSSFLLGFRFCPPPFQFQRAETEGDHCCHYTYSVKRRKDANHAIKYRNKSNWDWDWDWDTISTTGLDIPWSFIHCLLQFMVTVAVSSC